MNSIKHFLYVMLLTVGYNAYAAENKKYNDLVKKTLTAVTKDFFNEVNFESLLISNDEQRQHFLENAHSEKTRQILQKNAEAIVTANILLAKQNTQNNTLHTSPTKPSKTLPHKRKERSPGNTPPVRRKLFTNSLSSHVED